MPAVLCGLACFDTPVPCTAASAAKELSSSLDLGLDDAGWALEVYRLEPVEPDTQLEPKDVVLCKLPDSFDLAALEDLHCQLEDLRVDYKELQLQYGRTKEALMALSASVEASIASEPAGGIATEEVQQLRLQLAESERSQRETKATVIALRGEFMRLVEMWSDAGGPKYCADLPLGVHEGDSKLRHVRGGATPGTPHAHRGTVNLPPDILRGGGGASPKGFVMHPKVSGRGASQPPTTPGARAGGGSPAHRVGGGAAGANVTSRRGSGAYGGGASGRRSSTNSSGATTRR